MDTRHPHASRERGFTLTELLVTVLVLAVLTAVAGVPAAADGDAAALDLAQVQLEDAFRVAQTMSFSLGEPIGVVFDTEVERFAVVRQDGSPVADPLTHGDYLVEFRSPEQPKRVDIVSADFGTTLTAGVFDGSGVPVEGGTVTLLQNGLARTLVLDPATGRLEVGTP